MEDKTRAVFSVGEQNSIWRGLLAFISLQNFYVHKKHMYNTLKDMEKPKEHSMASIKTNCVRINLKFGLFLPIPVYNMCVCVFLLPCVICICVYVCDSPCISWVCKSLSQFGISRQT